MTTENHPTTGRAPWLTVAQRELIVLLTNKAFIISTITMIALCFGSMAASTLLAGGDKDTRIAAVAEARGLVEAYGKQVHDADEKKTVTVVEVADRAAGEALLVDGGATALVVPASDGYEVVVKKFDSGTTTVQSSLAAIAQSEALARNAAKAGVDPSTLFTGGAVGITALDGGNDRDAMMLWLAGMVFSIGFFMSAMMFGQQIAQSVTTEKQSRIVEILTAAIPVRQLLTGKVAAYTLVSLGQIVLLLGAGLLAVSRTSIATILPQLQVGALWFVPFFLIGFLALSTIWAAAGSLATRQEDLSQTTGPLMMVLGLAYVAGFTAQGTLAAVLSFVPILSTIIMPIRLMSGDATWWEGVIALVIACVFGAVMILVGERMYRRGLLATGKVMSFRQALAAK